MDKCCTAERKLKRRARWLQKREKESDWLRPRRTHLTGVRCADVPGKDDRLALGGIVEKEEPAGLAVDWDVPKANPVLG